jgi:hypothetical protein
MKKFTYCLVLLLAATFGAASVQAQLTTGSISGTVTDSSGAVVPGATVTVKGESGQNYTAVTNGEGVYNIPGVQAGTPTYTVSISATGFKTSVIQNVKVDVATPATVNSVLEAGKIEETVVVTSGAEVVQSSTATVGSTIQGRQILETPISTRNALDLVTLLPGTNVIGSARTSSVNGLPKSALTVQVDGVDVQDQFLKSSDGFFTFIQPKLDAIDEVTVSTSNPGAESSGDGAVGIRFQTRRGTDQYRGTFFWQHRDEGLNSANTQNNYLGLPKQKLRLNQFGGSVSGPLAFLGFGEGVPFFDSGKKKRYFFINYERYHLNEVSPTRTRQVLTSEAQSGIYRYGTNGANTVNLFTLAGSAGLVNTIDPTVNNVLNAIRSAAGTAGTFSPVGLGGIYYRQQYQFNNPGTQRRRFLTVRTDFNITDDHALEVIYNDQPFRSNVDFLNSVDPTFPGLQNAGAQNSERRSLSIGFRSSFGSNIVNQFRYAQLAGWLGGSTRFDLVGGADYFNNLLGGYNLTLGAGLTSPTIRNAFSSRVSPVRSFSDNMTWVKGNHTITFGGELKKAETISDSVSPYFSTITFGVATQDTALLTAISASNMPGATAAEVSNAQALYAALTGRITGYSSTVYLDASGKYQLNGSRHFEIEENTNGAYIQDSWRVRPNLQITGGVRWQPAEGTKMNTANYSLLNDFNMVYDVSGPGNLFKPGTLSGVVPTVRGNKIGEKAYQDDWNNFAPSIGVVWSPESAPGFLKPIFGKSGDSVFRGGFSRAFIREGTLIIENSVGQNPGGSFANNRSTALGNLVGPNSGTGTLFRTAGNPNLTAPAFNATPSYPRALTAADAALAFAPDFHTGYVDSWSFGYQRQIGKDTVVEVRYVGNRGKDMQRQYSINEINAIENGFGAEFALAQQNLLANIACANTPGCTGGGAHFRYRGPGTGTSPLPILVSYFLNTNADPTLTSSYTSSLFANTTFVNALSPANPNVLGFASTVESNFRAVGTAPGTNQRPINFFNNCPTTLGFCFLFDNSEKSWYDSVVVEVRRRLSSGVRFNASYVYGKAFTNAFASAGTQFFGLGAGDQSNASNVTLRDKSLDKSPAQVDIRHAFKVDATFDLPFGKGRALMNSSNWASNAVFGGWTIAPVVRWQSGSPILMEGIQLVGMTAKDLQKMIGVYHDQTITQPNGATSVANVTYLPADVIANTIRAFTTTGSSVTGYGAGQAPTGRFIAPAGYGNCQQRSPGQCGFRRLVIYGPSFFKIDTTVIKRIPFGEKHNVELRASFYDVLNQTNWRLGGWTGNVNNITAFTGTFGQMASGWSYQDPSGSNDPGGRVIDLMLRINW